MARPRKEIDYAVLDNMCAIQCTGEECAGVLNIDYDTLNAVLKRAGHGCFSEYFAIKRGKGKISLRRAQFKTAVENNNPTMLIWLGKQYLGQLDNKNINEGKPPEEQEHVSFEIVEIDASSE